jgi:hypothetical protein
MAESIVATTQQRALVSAATPTRQAIADALNSAGWHCWEPSDADSAPDCLIWDGDIRNANDRKRLAELRDQHPNTPCLAMSLAPRVEDWHRLAAFTSSIMSKPLLIADLDAWLQGVTE